MAALSATPTATPPSRLTVGEIAELITNVENNIGYLKKWDSGQRNMLTHDGQVITQDYIDAMRQKVNRWLPWINEAKLYLLAGGVDG